MSAKHLKGSHYRLETHQLLEYYFENLVIKNVKLI